MGGKANERMRGIFYIEFWSKRFTLLFFVFYPFLKQKSHPGKNKRKTKEAMPLYELSRESKTIGMVKLPLDAFMQGM